MGNVAAQVFVSLGLDSPPSTTRGGKAKDVWPKGQIRKNGFSSHVVAEATNFDTTPPTTKDAKCTHVCVLK